MTASPVELVLIKLGGSLITDKRRVARARPEVIARLGREIAAVRPELAEKLVVGHGSGSFGHVAAARHGIGGGPLATAAIGGASATQLAAADLHRRLVAAFERAGLAPYSWAPSSAVVARAGRPASGELRPLVGALELGLLPVVYGDLVMDREWGAAICSTESILRFLVGRLRRRGFAIRRLLWLGETDGVYDGAGATIPRIDCSSFGEVCRSITAPAGTDVTGGMLLRLETARWLARRGIESWIVNGTVPGLLGAALRGDDVPGSRFFAEP